MVISVDMSHLRRYLRCLMYLIASLSDSIFERRFPLALGSGSLSLSSLNDLFMSFILARSRSQAVLLYSSLLSSSSNLLAPVLFSWKVIR